MISLNEIVGYSDVDELSIGELIAEKLHFEPILVKVKKEQEERQIKMQSLYIKLNAITEEYNEACMPYNEMQDHVAKINEKLKTSNGS